MDFEELAQSISSLPLSEVGNAISKFTENSLHKFNFSTETKESKATLSSAIIKRFGELISLPDVSFRILQLVRILCRDGDLANDLSEPALLEALFSVAGFGAKTTASAQTILEAKKCCCNLFFLSNQARKEFKWLSELAESIRSVEDIEQDGIIFDLRLVFLLSGLSREDAQSFYDCPIHSALFFLLRKLDNECVGYFNNRYVQVSNECLKALFNVLSLRSAAPGKDALGAEINHDLAVLMKRYVMRPTADEDKEAEFHTNAINLLTLLHPSYYDLLFRKDLTVENSKHIEKDVVVGLPWTCLDDFDLAPVDEILEILSSQCDTTTAKNHEFIRPTLVLLTNIATFNRTICRYIRYQVLPPLRDVHHRPEVGSSLRNKVVRLMTSVSDVSAVAAEFLFVLCNFNVDRLIKYTGFGNAAGLLSANGLLAKYATNRNGESHKEESDENSDTEEYIAVKDKINPVLGCYEPDRPSSTEGMSEEQKEFEAMQLVNKIDKMMRRVLTMPLIGVI
ncbi:hypothetical protein M514_04670 [Trichuris suis]|uniref:Synembryn n=1 Tax=Trichuris suis TaxID=68888 RepID=A0A085N3T8_9BILA|nr:hypothetical protein M513_04670 [Trichuris suis]KFD64134.1 hypothetical protein M514_04670 [Trichuris suis]